MERERKRMARRAAVAAGLGIAVTATHVAAYNSFFPRYERPDYSVTPGLSCHSRIEHSLSRRCFFIPGRDTELAAYYYLSKNFRGLVVFSHGYRSGADDYLSLILALVECGYSVLAYDGVGTFDSGGTSGIGMCQALVDLDFVLNYIRESEYSDMPLYLVGHSRGGYAAASVLAMHPEVKAAALIAPMNNGATVMIDMAERYVGNVARAAKPFFNIYQRILFGDYVEYSGTRGINSTDAPVLIAQGLNDRVMTVDSLSIYAEREIITNPNVEYYLTDGACGTHSGILYSKRANEYREEVGERLEALTAERGELSHDELAGFYAEVDHALYSEVNDELVDAMIKIFKKSNK